MLKDPALTTIIIALSCTNLIDLLLRECHEIITHKETPGEKQ